ncbi:DUF4276 family protein [Streptosporangium sp. NPDC000239]|uniref:DUF4276 family protein n=1 Tax=Streptosporangium sp. NPDC000239 TaxID=3154248 RepID=UPI0033226655
MGVRRGERAGGASRQAGCRRRLRKQAERAGGPELVNDGRETAPSKRILAAYPGYRKTHDGPLAIADHGLAALRRDCPHLDAWVLRVLEGERTV